MERGKEEEREKGIGMKGGRQEEREGRTERSKGESKNQGGSDM